MVIEPKFSGARGFSNGLAAAKPGENIMALWGFIDVKGNWVIQPKFNEIKGFCEGVAAFRERGKWGLINTKGEVIHEAYFQDLIFPFTYGLIPAKENGKWGYLDTQGKWVIKPQFFKAGVFR